MNTRQLLTAMLTIFYLGVYKDHVALWKDGQSAPEIVYPYSVSIYPEADQQSLQHRIPIADRADFSRLLEDYLS